MAEEEEGQEEVSDPAGYLVDAIRKGYAAPEGFESKAERTKREEAKRERREAEARQLKEEARRRQEESQESDRFRTAEFPGRMTLNTSASAPRSTSQESRTRRSGFIRRDDEPTSMVTSSGSSRTWPVPALVRRSHATDTCSGPDPERCLDPGMS